MSKRTHRFRRVTAAAVLGMGMTAGVIGVTAGVAGAAPSSTHKATVTATKVYGVASTGSSTAGKIHVSVPSTWSLAAATTGTDTAYEFVATLSKGTWTTATTVTTGTQIGVAKGTPTAGTLPIKVTGSQAAAASFTITPKITESSLSGTVTVSFVLKKFTASGTTASQQTTSGSYFTGTPAIATTALATNTTNTTNTISASSAPTVPATGSGSPAGTLTVTLHVKTGEATSKLVLKTTSTGGASSVTWGSETVTSTGATATSAASGSTLTITLANATATTTATVHVKNITYTTTGAEGTVKVTPTWTYATAGTTKTAGTFKSPGYAVNAKAPAPAAVNPHTHTLTATSTPYVGQGVNGQAVGSWTLTFGATTSSATTAKTEGWTATHTVTITVDTHGGTNCSSTTNYVLITGTPTATVVGAKTVSATPAVTVLTSHAGTCTVANTNVVSLKFTNSGKFTGKTGVFKIMVTGVKYNIGKTATTTTVKVGADFTTSTTFAAASTTGKNATGPSNADISKLYVTANTPMVTVSPSTYNSSISPINVVETTPGQVGSGYVCINLTQTYTGAKHATADTFNTGGSASAKVTKGDATVTSKVTYEKSTGAAATTVLTAEYARFKVETASTKTASTFEVSGLHVNSTTHTGAVTAVVRQVALATNCSVTGTAIGAATTAYTVGAKTTQIAGYTAAATAAKELETTFNPTTGNATTGKCVGTTHTATNKVHTAAVTGLDRVVILATETHFQDALSSQYLAGYYKTGTLLTSTESIPAATQAALQAEGVTRVIVVGGSLAVSTTVVNSLKALPAYTCGGGKVMVATSKTEHLTVTRIYGYTAEDTAMKIATSAPNSYVASAEFPAAYLGTNSSGGNGKYNDTPGMASTAPALSGTLRTAIVASGTEFQDAMAASALAYHGITKYANGFPVLLTTPSSLSTAAKTAIVNLTIQQVVLMGGTDAVTNGVVSELQSLGVSVLRIAGMNYTDTATQFAKFLVNTTNTSGMGWTINGTVTVARGNGYTDGLAGAVISGYTSHPLLLTTSPTEVGKYLTAFLVAAGKASGKGIDTKGGKAEISTLTIFGGTSAVTPAVVSQMEKDINTG